MHACQSRYSGPWCATTADNKPQPLQPQPAERPQARRSFHPAQYPRSLEPVAGKTSQFLGQAISRFRRTTGCQRTKRQAALPRSQRPSSGLAACSNTPLRAEPIERYPCKDRPVPLNADVISGAWPCQGSATQSPPGQTAFTIYRPPPRSPRGQSRIAAQSGGSVRKRPSLRCKQQYCL